MNLRGNSNPYYPDPEFGAGPGEGTGGNEPIFNPTAAPQFSSGSSSATGSWNGGNRRRRQAPDFGGDNEINQGFDDQSSDIPEYEDLPEAYIQALEQLFGSLEELKVEVQRFKRPVGSRENPARTCKDLWLCHDDFEDGKIY